MDKKQSESMELQMSAERRKRASILTSEGDRESAVNSARGKGIRSIVSDDGNDPKPMFPSN